MHSIDNFQEGDWMECRGTRLISKIIRLRCHTVTNHGQPLHFKNGEWYVLDADFPRLKVTKLEDEIALAEKGDFDFYICRQKYEVPSDGYINAALAFEADIARRRPFYDIWSLIKFLFILPSLKKAYNLLIDLAKKDLKDLSVNQSISEEHLHSHIWNNFTVGRSDNAKHWVRFCVLYNIIYRPFYYCTELWQDIWLTEGKPVFKQLYGTDYCSPIEAERFSKDHCEFICGYYDQSPSDKLWQMTQK